MTPPGSPVVLRPQRPVRFARHSAALFSRNDRNTLARASTLRGYNVFGSSGGTLDELSESPDGLPLRKPTFARMVVALEVP